MKGWVFWTLSVWLIFQSNPVAAEEDDQPENVPFEGMTGNQSYPLGQPDPLSPQDKNNPFDPKGYKGTYPGADMLDPYEQKDFINPLEQNGLNYYIPPSEEGIENDDLTPENPEMSGDDKEVDDGGLRKSLIFRPK
jgi:hypothetical protein